MSESRLAITIDSRDSEAKAKALSRALDDLDKKGGKAAKSTKDVGDAARGASGGFASMGTAIRALALGVAVKGITGIYKSSMQSAVQLDLMAQQIGVTRESLDSLQYSAGQMAGASDRTLNSALRRLTRRLSEAAEGSGPAVKALESFNLNARELAELAPDEQVHAIADAMAKIDDPADRLRLARSLMDVEGQSLVNMFSQGGDAIREMEKEAQELAKTISDTDMLKFSEAEAAMARVRRQIDGTKQDLAISMAPAAEALTNIFVDMVGSTKNVEGGVDGIQEVLLSTLNVADSLWRILKFTGEAIGITAGALTELYGKHKESFVIPDLWATIKGEAGAWDRVKSKMTPSNWFSKEEEESVKSSISLLDELKAAFNETMLPDLAGTAMRAKLEKRRKELEEKLKEERGKGDGDGNDPVAPERNLIYEAYLREAESLERMIALHGDNTEAAKARYDVERGALRELSAAQKAHLVGMAEQYDQQVQHMAAQEAYKGLLLELRTEEERMIDTVREQVQVLKEAGIEGEEYADALERIIGATSTTAPQYAGMHASVGGASGELIRLAEAEQRLDEWRIKEIEKQERFLEEKLINEDEFAENVLKINAEMNEEQEAMRSAWQAATLGTFSAVTGDAAAMLKELGAESSLVYKLLFLTSKASSIAQAVVNTENAATKALTVDPTGKLSSVTRGLGYASIGIMAGTAVAGMAHDGLDMIPREGTWLLDKGERVLSPRQNADLTEYLKRQQAPSGVSSNVNVVVNISSDGSVDVQSSAEWREQGAMIGRFVEGVVTKKLIEEMRPYGLLDRS